MGTESSQMVRCISSIGYNGFGVKMARWASDQGS